MLENEEMYHKKQWEGRVSGIDYTQYFQTSKILENLSNIECMDEDLITLINMMSEKQLLQLEPNVCVH